jgi:hypothetical protein
VIVDVEATRAIRQAEVGASRTVVDRTEERFGLKPSYLVADTAPRTISPGSSSRGGSRPTFPFSISRCEPTARSRVRTSRSIQSLTAITRSADKKLVQFRRAYAAHRRRS